MNWWKWSLLVVNHRCCWADDGTAIAEWLAEFDDTAEQVRKRMREVALLTFDGSLIETLREYWASEVVELAQAKLPAGTHRSPREA